MLYRPSAVDTVTVTFTSWPWGKEGDGNIDSMDKEGVVMVVLEWSTVADMDHGSRHGPSLGPKRGVVLSMEVEALGEAVEVGLPAI